ncbi:MAG: S41 family peptidase [Candidatus Glassbacteria bacterium]|nr:S41 family peptidase [Candidatus Glassbacteria bacterium]
MNLRKARNPYVYASATILGLLLVGWLFGQLMATSDNTYKRLLLLQDVVNQVSLRYVDNIPADNLYHRAVEGLLDGLDPYTELIPAEDYERFKEIQVRSEYVGTGMSISRTAEQIVVMNVYPGSSAYRKGIQPGDRIIRINNESTRNWTTEQVSLRILGEQGSHVEVTVSRHGAEEPLKFTLTRKPVVVPTVTRHFMLDATTGYIRLATFTERSAAELRQHLQELLDQGMKSLVLDLRDNSGGLTDAAIKICELFMDGRQLIVAIKSRHPEESSSFFSDGKPLLKDGRLAVLINEFTASSSEILAGALQDHDRAVIVGQNSYGKGLVQTTYPLKSGDVLKITTARYYTPSGRNIQREFFSRVQRLQDDPDNPAADEEIQAVFETDMGREVLGGGGIAPDVKVKMDSASVDPYVVRLNSHTFDFAVAYKSMNPGLSQPFKADRKIYDAFVSYLEAKEFKLDRTKTESYRGYITDYLLTYRIAEVAWDDNAAYRMVAMEDAQLSRALEVLGSASSQKEILRRLSEEASE